MSQESDIRINWGDLKSVGAAPPLAPDPRLEMGRESHKPTEPSGAQEIPTLSPDQKESEQYYFPNRMKANRKVAGRKCAICHGTIELAQDVCNCLACKLPFHSDCWDENRGCATYGCMNAPQAAKQIASPSLVFNTVTEIATKSGHGAPVSTPYHGVTPTLVYAGFARRFCAWFLDWVMLLIALAIINPIAGAFFTGMTGDPEAGEGLAGLIGLFGPWLYFAGMEASTWSSTLGKRMLDIYVSDMEGRRVSFARATGRYWAKWLSFFTVIGYLMAAFMDREQALHDLIADTLVLKRVPGSSEQPLRYT